MSDTPRTDSSELPHALDDHHFVVGAFFARQLERELNAASKERDDALMMLGMYRMKSDEQNQRIKRLEEESESRWLLAQSAVESCAEMSSRIKRLEEAGDKIVEAGWSVQDWSGMCVVWAKAKEDKP